MKMKVSIDPHTHLMKCLLLEEIFDSEVKKKGCLIQQIVTSSTQKCFIIWNLKVKHVNSLSFLGHLSLS